MPAAETASEILRILYTPEEARIVSVLQLLPLFRTARQAAAAARMDPETADRMLRSLSDRGLVIQLPIAGRLRYILIPLYPGLFELPFMGREPHPRKKELAALWEKYHFAELKPEVYEQDPPAMRVVPIRRSIASEPSIHRFEDAAALIRSARVLAVGACACRTAFEHCDSPRDTCIIFNLYSEYLVERGFARAVTADEALEILERAERAGLVHCSVNVQNNPAVICNCCPCCCGFLRGVAELQSTGAVAVSGFQATVDPALCDACGVCAVTCPVKAINVVDGVGYSDPRRCIGCGQCGRRCPNGAVTLRPRAVADVPAKSIPRLVTRMYVGKVKKIIKKKSPPAPAE